MVVTCTGFEVLVINYLTLNIISVGLVIILVGHITKWSVSFQELLSNAGTWYTVEQMRCPEGRGFIQVKFWFRFGVLAKQSAFQRCLNVGCADRRILVDFFLAIGRWECQALKVVLVGPNPAHIKWVLIRMRYFNFKVVATNLKKMNWSIKFCRDFTYVRILLENNLDMAATGNRKDTWRRGRNSNEAVDIPAAKIAMNIASL